MKSLGFLDLVRKEYLKDSFEMNIHISAEYYKNCMVDVYLCSKMGDNIVSYMNSINPLEEIVLMSVYFKKENSVALSIASAEGVLIICGDPELWIKRAFIEYTKKVKVALLHNETNIDIFNSIFGEHFCSSFIWADEWKPQIVIRKMEELGMQSAMKPKDKFLMSQSFFNLEEMLTIAWLIYSHYSLFKGKRAQKSTKKATTKNQVLLIDDFPTIKNRLIKYHPFDLNNVID